MIKRPFVPDRLLDNDTSFTYSLPLMEGYVSYQPHRFIHLSGGVGKTLLGMVIVHFLSDYAPAYPFPKWSLHFGR